MSANYYDVVVMGTALGPLTAGALLAKRGFRVLVIGGAHCLDTYNCQGFEFVRKPFLLTAAQSPIVRKVVDELSFNQQFQQLLETPNPLFQLVLPKARVDVFEDHTQTLKSICRELEMENDDAERALREIGRIGGEIDKLFQGDFVVPSETFFERREVSRAQVQNPFNLMPGVDLFELLDRPPASFETLLSLISRVETGDTAGVNAFVKSRQMGGWLFGTQKIKGGLDELRALLCECIVSGGGDVRSAQQLSEIVVSKGKIVGIRTTCSEKITGCKTLLTDKTPQELSSLIAPGQWTKRFRAQMEDAPDTMLGYALNMGVNATVIPEGLAGTALISFGPGLGDNLLRVETIAQKDPSKAALNVSCMVSPSDSANIDSGVLRDAILDRMRSFVPFLDNHLQVLHSSFDSFGAICLGVDLDRSDSDVIHPEEVPRWRIRLPGSGGVFGIEGLPYRTGIKGLIFSGSQVVSGIGAEGEFLAGWCAARIASKLDPHRERLVRSMRSKVEI